LQTKILRVLQEKEVSPLGSSKSISIQTRVISATLRNLEDEVQRGRFREDLLFRINVFTLYLPPLRERRSDIVQLANSFIQSFAERYSKEIRPISHELALKLEAYSWPGNVRELQNAIERAVVLTKTDSVHIEDLLRHKIRAQNAPEADFDRLGLSYTDAKDNFEKSFLLRVLKASKGSIAEAARISGRYRSDIYRLMERYQIQPHEFK
ncbi:MAG: sigma 54-interacting transcriptional regulator, partial [Proteobacteria bacterium]|nr:sigma 54-interacting transcriptional regulator [Pseudomonadota bacterium]